MSDKEYKFKDILLSYSITGNGKKCMLTFHGFGQTKHFFKPFDKVFGEDYMLYNFDLFFHGKSQWYEGEELLTKEFWCELMNEFFSHYKIDRFSLSGYSMGGKFVLTLLECFPERVDQIILIAPDGIKTSFWYSLATYPSWARWLFKSSVNNPKIFQRFASVIRSLRLVDKSLMKFANTQMDTEEKRNRVYYSWVVFRMLKFDLNKIAALINKYHIPFYMFLGKYDRMIKEKNLQKLLKNVHNYKLEVLETGHNKLITEVADYYSKNLINNNG